MHASIQKPERYSQNDNRYLNYLALTTMITRAMQRRTGKHRIDFEVAADLAWEVAQQISSDQLLEKARSLTVREILDSRSVRQDL